MNFAKITHFLLPVIQIFNEKLMLVPALFLSESRIKLLAQQCVLVVKNKVIKLGSPWHQTRNLRIRASNPGEPGNL